MAKAQDSRAAGRLRPAPHAGASLFVLVLAVSLPSTLVEALYILEPVLPIPGGTGYLFAMLHLLLPPVLFAQELLGLLGVYGALLVVYMIVEPWVRRFPAELRDAADWVPGSQPSLWRIAWGNVSAAAGIGFGVPGTAAVLLGLWVGKEALWLVGQPALIIGGAVFWAGAWPARRLFAAGTLVPGRVMGVQQENGTIRVPVHDGLVPVRTPPVGAIVFSYEHEGRTRYAQARVTGRMPEHLPDGMACWVLVDAEHPDRALLLDLYLRAHLRRFLNGGAFAAR